MEDLFPQWRKVYSPLLKKDILVRRPTIGDMQLPIEEMWLRLARNADNTTLFPNVNPKDASPKLVEEICNLATENFTNMGELKG